MLGRGYVGLPKNVAYLSAAYLVCWAVPLFQIIYRDKVGLGLTKLLADMKFQIIEAR